MSHVNRREKMSRHRNAVLGVLLGCICKIQLSMSMAPAIPDMRGNMSRAAGGSQRVGSAGCQEMSITFLDVSERGGKGRGSWNILARIISS